MAGWNKSIKNPVKNNLAVKTDFIGYLQKATLFQDTAVVLTDCNYSLLLNGQETTHHFAVTEVYIRQDDSWKLIQFSFTALVY